MKWTIITIAALIVITGCIRPPDVQIAQVNEPAIIVEQGTTQTLQLDTGRSTFEFEGYGPGKSHKGTFSDWDGTVALQDNVITKVSWVVQIDSVDVGIDGLNKHLKTEDFFDAEKFPQIVFESTSIEGGSVTGNLDFHGVKKEISFAADITTTTATADFLLDTTPFGIKYIGMNKDVRIMFEMFTKQ